MLRILALVILLSTQTAWSESSQSLIQKVFDQYRNGRYENVVKTLNDLQKRVKTGTKKGREIQGLIYYWKAMSFARLNEFDQAEKFFKEAIKIKYQSKDIYYEYGQVLYVSEKYKRARIAFKKSVKQKYKVAVSLYYIGFISQELKEYKKAVNFYNLIEKLPEEEKAKVVQAARMQVGDVYLAQVERQPDVYNSVKDYVIPQYEKALDYDKESPLAGTIKQKIENLQKKYELVLFRMRNGRTTARPPYYLRANVLYGTNDNVTTLDEDSKAGQDTEDYASAYTQTGVFYRHSFYPNSAFSLAPELSAAMTNYLSDSESLKPFNSYFYTVALKTNYEFIYNNAPATIFTDVDYTYNADDADADDEFAEASQVVGLSLSSQLELWKSNPSTFRLRYATTDAVTDTSDLTTVTLGYEQIVLLKSLTLFFFNQYAMNTFTNDDSLNNNALTSRLDVIFGTVKILTPTVYVSMLNTEFVNDSDSDPTSLLTYGVNLSRKLSKKWYLTFDYSQGTQRSDTDTDNYNAQIMTLNLDYIY